MGLSDEEVVLRIAAAVLAGFLVGFERELGGHQAGLRTHVLVCLGACLFTLAGYVTGPGHLDGEDTRLDVTRVASQVVVGIGFLGGGSILRHGTTVRGLTTAANLWVTAALGLALGLGLFAGAAAALTAVLLTLVALRPLEGWIQNLKRRRRMPDDQQ
jgi:putative Mg2+ transporter-C (MgtC) family protein